MTKNEELRAHLLRKWACHYVMKIKTDPRDHLSEGRIIYPVYSRRLAGISVGVNLFPEKKICNFDCPYCYVSSAAESVKFSIERMAADLECLFDTYPDLSTQGHTIKDICISGDGEPTLSPILFDVIGEIARIRQRRDLRSRVGILMITNATRLLERSVREPLSTLVREENLTIWAKLDAGTEKYYKQVNLSAVPFETITRNISTFSRDVPIAVQTMLVSLHGDTLPPEELSAYTDLLKSWLDQGSKLTELQLYTQGRPPTYSYSAPVSEDFLLNTARTLQKSLNFRIPVKAYGETGRLQV